MIRGSQVTEAEANKALQMSAKQLTVNLHENFCDSEFSI